MVRHYVLDAVDLALWEPDVAAGTGWDLPSSFAAPLSRPRAGPAELPPAADARLRRADTRPRPAVFAEYARRDQTRREHSVEFQRYLPCGVSASPTGGRLRGRADAARATDRGEPIVHPMLAHLRANRVLLPSAQAPERIGLAARPRARKKTFETLAAGRSDSERDTLTGLLTVDSELRRSRVLG